MRKRIAMLLAVALLLIASAVSAGGGSTHTFSGTVTNTATGGFLGFSIHNDGLNDLTVTFTLGGATASNGAVTVVAGKTWTRPNPTTSYDGYSLTSTGATTAYTSWE